MTEKTVEEKLNEYLRLANDPEVMEALEIRIAERLHQADLDAAWKEGFEIGLKEAREELAKKNEPSKS